MSKIRVDVKGKLMHGKLRLGMVVVIESEVDMGYLHQRVEESKSGYPLAADAVKQGLMKVLAYHPLCEMMARGKLTEAEFSDRLHQANKLMEALHFNFVVPNEDNIRLHVPVAPCAVAGAARPTRQTFDYVLLQDLLNEQPEPKRD